LQAIGLVISCQALAIAGPGVPGPYGSLGADFDGGGEDLPAERRRALVIGQGLQKEIDCLTDFRQDPERMPMSGRGGVDDKPRQGR
jgi:hypothetical protein